jgi:hypothetical protein
MEIRAVRKTESCLIDLMQVVKEAGLRPVKGRYELSGCKATERTIDHLMDEMLIVGGITDSHSYCIFDEEPVKRQGLIHGPPKVP